eukprot:TRINITY_DN7326_c0_g1_i1.p1 TRINITY_DN7326_c0_g1~~TRINITY_DN7326_c0_g1_i1.p1  ORF type:complete len:975 (-),score=205.24 TRINITY_DN7326_c0_g1_i1:264-3188(-)
MGNAQQRSRSNDEGAKGAEGTEAFPAAAAERIESARSGHGERLDLSGLGVSLLPNGSHLSQVSVLMAPRNHIRILASTFGSEWAQLTTIDLSHNALTVLPSDVTRLTALQTLTLAGNALLTLDLSEHSDASVFAHMPHMRRIDLAHNALTAIPAQILRLPLLEVVVLRGNGIHHIPRDAFPDPRTRLARLTRLDLARNRIDAFSLALVDPLVALCVLSLASNHLRSITQSLPELPSGHRDLEQMQGLKQQRPSKESAETKVTHTQRKGKASSSKASNSTQSSPINSLDSAASPVLGQKGSASDNSALNGIGENRICSFPASLQTLDVQENWLRDFPEFHRPMHNLVSLNISRNQLTTLPSPLSRLASLESLILSHNRLSVLPPDISYLTTLDELDLSNNVLASLPETLGSMRCLRKLHLHRNSLTSLPSSLWKLPSIRLLNLCSNFISALPQLVQTDSPLTECLVELYLSDNQLTEFPQQLLHCTNITSLGISYNNISALSQDMDRLVDLRLLFTSGNQLWNLPEKLKDIFGLRWVYINHNRMRDLPDVLGDLPLEILDFTGIEAASSVASHVTGMMGDFGASGGAGRRRSDGFRLHPTITSSNRFSVGFGDMIGRRQTMEDSIAIKGSFRGLHDEDLFGVFDGHGTGGKGKIAADYIAYHIPKELESSLEAIIFPVGEPTRKAAASKERIFKSKKERPNGIATLVEEEHEDEAEAEAKAEAEAGSPTDASDDTYNVDCTNQEVTADVPPVGVPKNSVQIGDENAHTGEDDDENVESFNHSPQERKLILNAMRDVFLKVNTALLEEIKQQGDVVGSTAAVAYVRRNILYVANAGDSRVLLCRDSHAIQLTMDHRPQLESEELRIKKAGGFVSSNLRVNNELSVSRAFGDARLVPIVTAEPHLTSIQLFATRDKFLVIACDGLFDVMSNQQVVDHVRVECAKTTPSATAAACRLRDMAYQLGSTDNISVVVVFLA